MPHELTGDGARSQLAILSPSGLSYGMPSTIGGSAVDRRITELLADARS